MGWSSRETNRKPHFLLFLPDAQAIRRLSWPFFVLEGPRKKHHHLGFLAPSGSDLRLVASPRPSPRAPIGGDAASAARLRRRGRGAAAPHGAELRSGALPWDPGSCGGVCCPPPPRGLKKKQTKRHTIEPLFNISYNPRFETPSPLARPSGQYDNSPSRLPSLGCLKGKPNGKRQFWVSINWPCILMRRSPQKWLVDMNPHRMLMSTKGSPAKIHT